MPVQCLGIYREKRFSPGVHATGDAEILELTQAALERLGYQTTLIAPESLPTMPPSAPVVFSMCQSFEALAVLQAWEQQGVLVLNTPTAAFSLALPESTSGWWVKRGDVHAMQSDDVRFVHHAADLPVQLARVRQ